MRVLVINDDDDCDILCEALKVIDENVECLRALDGLEAIEILDSLNDKCLRRCILLDVQMPRMGGMECLERIKQMPRVKHIPVIICSGTTDPEHAFLDVGAKTILIKSVSFLEIVDTLVPVLQSIGH